MSHADIHKCTTYLEPTSKNLRNVSEQGTQNDYVWLEQHPIQQVIISLYSYCDKNKTKIRFTLTRYA